MMQELSLNVLDVAENSVRANASLVEITVEEVNGPGEAREADIGIAGGIGEGLLIKKGEVLKKVPEGELLEALRAELLAMQKEQG